MSNDIGALVVTLEAQTASFEKGMNSAIKSIQRMEDKIKESNTAFGQINKQFQSITSSVGLMTTALGALGGLGYLKSLMDGADAASDLGDAFGIAINQVYAYQTALLAAGGKADGFDKVMQKVATNMTDAFEGSQTARKGFEQLGISLQEIKTKSVGETFDQIAVQLSKIEDPAKRNAVALDILGKSALGIDWVKYAKDIDETKKSYEKLETPLKRAAELSDELTLATKNFGTYVLATFAGIPNVFRKVAQGFMDLKDIITGNLTIEDSLLFSEMELLEQSTLGAAKNAQVLGREIKALGTDPFTTWKLSLEKSKVEAEMFTQKMAYLDEQMKKATTSEQIKVIQSEMEKLNGINPFEAWKDGVDKASQAYSMLIPQLEYLAELRNLDMLSLEEYNKEIEKLGFGMGKQTDEMTQMFNSLQQSLAGFGQQFSSQFVDNLMKGKLTVENFLNDLTAMILKFMMNQLVQKFITGFMGAAFGAPTVGVGAVSASSSSDSTSRMGGEPSSGFSMGVSPFQMRMADVAVPSLSMVSTSNHPSLGVSQQPMNVIINNTVSNDTKVSTAEVTNNDGSKSLQIMIEKQVKEMFGTGAMDKSMRASYGLVRSAA